MSPVQIAHFSDILCVWAYVGQSNLNRLASTLGSQIEVDVHFCSVFPDTRTKIEEQWKDREGFAGYGRHVQGVAGKFTDMPVHGDTWSKTRPRSSASPHLFVKAVELLETENASGSPVPFSDRLSVWAARELRAAFFVRAEDVAHWNVQREIAQRIGIDFDDVIGKIETGEAIAKLAADYDFGQSLKIEGSPTYVLNDGRQKLFGNVSYGVIEANVTELLADENDETASLCT
jgi:predicted DsbA family dithiol-disulfide isomerase